MGGPFAKARQYGSGTMNRNQLSEANQNPGDLQAPTKKKKKKAPTKTTTPAKDTGPDTSKPDYYVPTKKPAAGTQQKPGMIKSAMISRRAKNLASKAPSKGVAKVWDKAPKSRQQIEAENRAKAKASTRSRTSARNLKKRTQGV